MAEGVYPKGRVDAMTDGVFAVAMTLLVLDVRLPDDFNAQTAGDLLHGIVGLWPKFFPYLLSFATLGMRWLIGLRVHSAGERVGRSYAMWTMLYLLVVTCLPFSTIVVGRFASLAPAVWLYAGNLAAINTAGYMVARATRAHGGRGGSLRPLVVFLFSSALAIGWSFVDPGNAYWFLLLNLAMPLLRRRGGRGGHEASPALSE